MKRLWAVTAAILCVGAAPALGQQYEGTWTGTAGGWKVTVDVSADSKVKLTVSCQSQSFTDIQTGRLDNTGKAGIWAMTGTFRRQITVSMAEKTVNVPAFTGPCGGGIATLTKS